MAQHGQTETSDRSSGTADLPIPTDGVIVTHLLIVSDIDRSKSFYEDVLGARTVMKDPPAILRFYNTWLILSTAGGPTDDKPGIAATPPGDSATLTGGINLRVANIYDLYERWRASGATFLTPPKEHPSEIRYYLRDPDGHLIEVGLSKQRG